MVTHELHHDMFVVLYKIVTSHNVACVCDDGQTGCIISYKDSAVRFFIVESVSLYQKKRVMVRQGLHHLLTQYKGFMF